MKPRIMLTSKVDAKGRSYPDESWRGRWRCGGGFGAPGYGETPLDAYLAWDTARYFAERLSRTQELQCICADRLKGLHPLMMKDVVSLATADDGRLAPSHPRARARVLEPRL